MTFYRNGYAFLGKFIPLGCGFSAFYIHLLPFALAFLFIHRLVALCSSPNANLFMLRFIFSVRLVALGLLFVALSPNLYAQTWLDEAVITANRLPQKQGQTAKVLTILPDSVLRRHDAQTLSQLLHTQVGLWILGANAAPGTNQNVYMRGAGVGYVSILLNGIPINDPSAPIGNFDLNVIPIAQIERVEILKGSQSVVYGTDAVAGVINIISRREYAEKWRLWATFSGGSYGNLQATAGIMGKIKKLEYGLQYARQQTNGFSAAYDSLSTQNFEADGLQSHNVRLQLAQQIAPKLNLRGIAQYAQYDADLDAAAFKDDKDYSTHSRHITTGVGFDANWGNIDWRGNYAFYDTDRQYNDDSTDVPIGAFSRFSEARYQSQTHFAELYGNRKIGERLTLLAGAELRTANTTQRYVSISDFGVYEEPPIGKDSANIAQYSAYISALWHDIVGFNAELGLRFNAHSLYGNHITYNVGLSRYVGKRVKCFASLSSGYRAPSLYQLFSIYGNRDLQPEIALHYEGGLQYVSENGKLSGRVLGFGRHTNDIITTLSLADYPYLQYINQDKQRDYGIEADFSYSIAQLNFTLGYAFVNGKVSTLKPLSQTDTTYNNLFRRPKHRLTAAVSYRITPKLFAQLRLQTSSKRQDLFFDENTFSTVQKTLNQFALLDLHLSYQFTPKLKLFADVRNISNATYFELSGYSTRRFNFDVGISLDFKQAQ
jgi:vitamin B12 transporter